MTVSSEYWEKIPLWNSEGNRFEVMADDYSGRIPVTRIERWQDFTAFLDGDFFDKPGTKFVYRGQRRFDWSMMPTLGRVTSSGIISEELANEQLTSFRQAIRGRISDHSLLINEDQDDELWSVGQHHGLMTPLLDWTYSPYVALFFAFSKEDQDDEKDNPYRAIYVLNKSFVEDDDLCPDIRIFEPKKDDHGRLVSQAGLFTFSPYDATIENKLTEILGSDDFGDEELQKASEEEEADILAKYICKIYIKNEGQQECLKHLRRMNVHHASLFPDLIGASEHCNIIISENERERLLSEAIKSIRIVSEETTISPVESLEVSVDEEAIDALIGLLETPEESHEVEPGRIKLIAEKLSKNIFKYKKLVDWEKRDTIKAEIRNTTRVLLRKYGYPINSREYIVENILTIVPYLESSEEEQQ